VDLIEILKPGISELKFSSSFRVKLTFEVIKRYFNSFDISFNCIKILLLHSKSNSASKEDPISPLFLFSSKYLFTSVFIRRRTEDEIADARSVKLDDLKDPEKDEDRAKNPEWLVMLGVCTHLGCVPLNDKGDYNGWFCPCHGSHYDTSGRIRKGPAPTNMEVPKYEFVNANTIKIG